MKVYIVFYEDDGHLYIKSVWANKENAEYEYKKGYDDIQEWEVRGTP